MTVSVAEAESKLPELIRAAEDGEAVTICRDGVPVVELVRSKEHAVEEPAASGEPKWGTLRDHIVIHDPDWWKPMTDEEADAFIDGKY